MKDGSKKKYFLEYERSLKNRNRYKEIFQYYANRDDVHDKNVLYVCGNEAIRKELIRVEERMACLGVIDRDKYFQFITLDELCKSQARIKNNADEKVKTY